MKIGIDFGTTHTVTALADQGSYPVVGFEEGDAVPSLIAVRTRDGERRFGWDAFAVAHDPEWSVLRSFKRLLGGAGPLTEVIIGGRAYFLLDLLTEYFAALRGDLIRRSNAGVRRGQRLQAAVSVPANALGAQRFLTVEAFRRAGFEVVLVMNEPSAAGFEYHHRHQRSLSGRREYVLVYDLGGGTFDTSLIHMAARANEVISSAGVQRLGGDDFDEVILNLVAWRIDREVPARARDTLLEECRRSKERVEPNTRRFVVDLSCLGLPPLALPMDEVYGACRPLVGKTIEAMEPLLRELRQERGGSVSWNDVASLYTVGGMSRFPLVHRVLRETFGENRVRRSPQPFAATAIGLAISLDTAAGFKLADRLTRSFGVWRDAEAGRGIRFDVIFPRGTRIPGLRDTPLTASREYRAAHNMGHYRYVECSGLREGEPSGDLLSWGEIRFPFALALRDAADLSSVPVERCSEEGPMVTETYRCHASGIIEVTLSTDDGFSRNYKVTPPKNN